MRLPMYLDVPFSVLMVVREVVGVGRSDCDDECFRVGILFVAIYQQPRTKNSFNLGLAWLCDSTHLAPCISGGSVYLDGHFDT